MGSRLGARSCTCSGEEFSEGGCPRIFRSGSRSTVHSYFVLGKYPGKQGVSVLEQALRQEVGAARIQDGRPALTSFLIVDSQSVKNTDTAERKGYDAGKMVSGIQRHLAVDTPGLPPAIEVTTTDVIDRQGGFAGGRSLSS